MADVPDPSTPTPHEPVAVVTTPVAGLHGAAPPGYRAGAHREYYRFGFAGLFMALGCLMPFGGLEQERGYCQVLGALYLVIAVGVVWSMWIAIYGGPFTMRWLLVALIPFAMQLAAALDLERDAGLAEFRAARKPIADGWVDLVAQACAGTAEGVERARNFCRGFGAGRIVLLAGASLNVWLLGWAVLGGVRHLRARRGARAAGGRP